MAAPGGGEVPPGMCRKLVSPAARLHQFLLESTPGENGRQGADFDERAGATDRVRCEDSESGGSPG